MISTSSNTNVLTKVLRVSPDFFKTSGVAGYSSSTQEGPLDLYATIDLLDFGFVHDSVLPKNAIVHSAIVTPNFKIYRIIEGTNKKVYVKTHFTAICSNGEDSSRRYSNINLQISGDETVSEDALHTLVSSVQPHKKFEKEDLLHLTITIFYSIVE